MNKRVMLSMLVGLIVLLQALPLAAAQSTPSIDEILDKYVAALGGKAAIQKATTTMVKGTFDLPAMGINGTMEGYQKAPNKSFNQVDIPGFGTIQQGYNGTVGWASEPQGGLRELTGVELSQRKRESEFYKEIKLKELYPKMVLKGKEKVGDREAYVIEATPADGAAEKMYFDTQSGLMIKQDVETETPQGKMSAEIFLEDYKEVDGVKLPFTTRQVNPALSFTIKITEAKRNVPVDDAKFNKPAEK